MAKYTYVVADLLSGDVLDEIPFVNVSWGRVLNAPGSFSGSIHRTHPKAKRATLDPGRRALYVIRDGGGVPQCVWGGILWTAKRTSDMLEFGALGFWSYFRRRIIRRDRVYTNTEQLTIVRDLISDAQGLPQGDIGVVVSNLNSGRTRAREYRTWELKELAEAVEQLAAVIDGFDFSIDVDWDGDSTFTPTLNFFYPAKGRRLEQPWDERVHFTTAEWTIDSTQQATWVAAAGSGDGDAMRRTSYGNPSTGYPLLETSVANKDVSVMSTLEAMAREEFGRRSMPIVLPTIDLKPTPETVIGAWTEGDQVQILGDDFIPDQWCRIMAFDVSVSDDGYEETQVELEDVRTAAKSAYGVA
jgi:hypothetical protein